MVRMLLHDVRVDVSTNTPVVLLREAEGLGRTLPIYIGAPEASSIAYAVRGTVHDRPLTHDLMRDLLVAFGATVDKVVVTDVQRGIYIAELHITLGDRVHVVSSRPSDAVALAARTGAAIYADEDVLDANAVLMAADDDGEPEEEAEELVDEFRSFIDRVRPEDFTS